MNHVYNSCPPPKLTYTHYIGHEQCIITFPSISILPVLHILFVYKSMCSVILKRAINVKSINFHTLASISKLGTVIYQEHPSAKFDSFLSKLTKLNYTALTVIYLNDNSIKSASQEQCHWTVQYGWSLALDHFCRVYPDDHGIIQLLLFFKKDWQCKANQRGIKQLWRHCINCRGSWVKLVHC